MNENSILRSDFDFKLSGFRFWALGCWALGFRVLGFQGLQALAVELSGLSEWFRFEAPRSDFFFGHRGPNGGDDGVVRSFSKNDR